MRLPSDLLARGAEEGSRLLALTYLDQCSSAQRRTADDTDREALHDFRVGLRRLRSCIRAYRSELDESVPKKMRRQLRELTAATNPVRDAEVQLAWLKQQWAQLQAGEVEGLAWLVGRLEGRNYEALDQRAQETAARYSKLAAKLRRRLSSFRIEVRTGKQNARQSLAEVTARLVGEQAAELATSLGEIRASESVAAAHAVRIRAKRLRYLLEPLSSRVPGVRGAVRHLKQLQDVLGQLHDLQVMDAEITSSLAVFSSSPERAAGAAPGLSTLQRLARAQADASFASFQSQWAEAQAARFFARVEGIARKLEETVPGAQPERREAPPPTLTVTLTRASLPAMNPE